MKLRDLGKTDLKVSSIGMGCVTFGREIDETTSFEVLDHAFERGINFFDTAAVYAQGASETVLGKWISERNVRNNVVLATKVHGTQTKEHVIASAEQSLQRLQTDHIDLFYLHNWDGETPMEETLGALNALVESGKVRAIACSNWQAWQLAKSLLLCAKGGLRAMDCVQPPYNLVQREIEADLIPLCADQQIGVVAYSPLAAGFLTGKYRRDEVVPKGTRFDVIPAHQPIYFTDHGYAVVEELSRAAEREGKSMVQLALGWVLSRPQITSVLIGARNRDQVDQAFEAESIGAECAGLFS